MSGLASSYRPNRANIRDSHIPMGRSYSASFAGSIHLVCEQWLATIFHVPDCFTQVSVQCEMVWPVTVGESYVRETAKSMKAAQLAWHSTDRC